MGLAFQRAKSAIKRRFPSLLPIYGGVYRRFILQPRLRRTPVEDIFDEIYRERAWGGTESCSGRGSTLAETTALREALPGLVDKFGIRSMLDIPCGDGHWMSQVAARLERYIAADVVADLLSDCRMRWPAETKAAAEFLHLNLIQDPLPTVDLIFCRECIVHFSFADAFRAFKNMKLSGSKFLFTTTYPGRRNREIATGEWRAINLQAPPFSFPEPLRILNEQSVDPPGNDDKSMGLWRISDLPDFTERTSGEFRRTNSASSV